MKKQITITALGILMIASAMAMYGGGTYPLFNTTLNDIVYTVAGNSSDIENLTINLVNGTIYASTPLNYKPDNFTLIFFDNITREVIKPIYIGGGGGSRTKYVDRNVTVYVPEYINTTETVEVEKIIENEVEKIEYQETGYKLWHLFFGMIITGLFVWRMVSSEKKYPSAEEIVEYLE